jgi:hypothetical protein
MARIGKEIFHPIYNSTRVRRHNFSHRSSKYPINFIASTVTVYHMKGNNRFMSPRQYNRSFEGACIDSGAQRSVIGLDQAKNTLLHIT